MKTLLLIPLYLWCLAYMAFGQTNGDFANGLADWTATGNVFADSGRASFNGNSTSDSTPNGVLTQTIPTVAGAAYTLTFAISASGSASGTQTISVNAGGTVTTVSYTKPAVVQWTLTTLPFTAAGATTTLTFADVSTVTSGIDLLLDNVTVTPVAVVPTITGTSVTLAWNANPEPDITGYTVAYGTNPASLTSAKAVGNVITTQITGLTPGPWYFALTATNPGGTSPATDPVNALMVAPPAVRPSRPTGLKVQPPTPVN